MAIGWRRMVNQMEKARRNRIRLKDNGELAETGSKKEAMA